jgi:type I restriction enzyme M protein
MIRVVDPKKGETIMDPACGTAGFLVSAYRYIAEGYTSEKMKKAGSPRAMDKLSSDEKNFLFNHMFTGFDSDEDMIKFGMMNLHLHGLTKSHLIRQNSLTDTSGMKGKFDVILANPPFAGKIDEESVSEDIRMGTKATELLFLRFMMDHLSTKGKLAVIVPEGVIFNSSKAHSKIREMLIEKGLWAVVSLPSGVFNPYAGVKTSLLFLDQDIAKKSKEVVFIKVTNDGFDLGAQRRPITKNDLPITLDVLNEWKSGKKIQDSLVNYVEKSKINESNDYSLSGDRYIETTDHSNTKWSKVSLGDILDYEQPTEYIVKSVDYRDEYPTPVLTAGKTFILGYTNEKEGIFTEGLPVIIFDDFTTATKLVDFPFKVKSSAMKILRAKNEKIDIRYVFYAMQSIKFSFSEHKRFWISEYSKIKIPLPPLEVQKQIIKELDHYQKMIEGAKMFTEDWTPKIEIDPSWKKVKLGEVCKIGSSKRVFESEWKDSGVPFYRAREIVKLAKNGFVDNELYISEKMFDDYSKKYGSPKEGDLMVTGVGTLGICYLVKKEDKFYFKDGNIIWLRDFNDLADSRFVKYLFEDDFVKNQIKASATGGTVGTYTITNANNTIIPLPPIKVQKDIVEKIDFERRVIDSTKGFIPVLEQKIKDRIAKLWE